MRISAPTRSTATQETTGTSWDVNNSRDARTCNRKDVGNSRSASNRRDASKSRDSSNADGSHNIDTHSQQQEQRQQELHGPHQGTLFITGMLAEVETTAIAASQATTLPIVEDSNVVVAPGKNCADLNCGDMCRYSLYMNVIQLQRSAQMRTCI